MIKDRGHRENGADASRPRTEAGEIAQRARSFFDRATERAREAARDIGRRMRGDEREREPHRYRGQEVMDRTEGWFGRPDRDRTLNRGGRDFGDQSYGGHEPPYYGQEQYRSRDRGLGMRDDYASRMYGMYGGRESGRDWMRDERDRDYRRDEDRGFRANLGGGYRMTSDRGSVRDPMGDWGNDRDAERGRDREDNRFERDDRSRDRRW